MTSPAAPIFPLRAEAVHHHHQQQQQHYRHGASNINKSSSSSTHEVNEAFLHRQQALLVQRLLQNNNINNTTATAAATPTTTLPNTTATPLCILYEWRSQRCQPKLPQVVLLLILEDMMRRHGPDALSWQTLQDAWCDLLQPRHSAVHLILDHTMLALPESSSSSSPPNYLDFRTPQTLWNLAKRLDRALRLHAQPLSVEEEDPPRKRPRLAATTTTTTAPQQAVATVLIWWLATVEVRIVRSKKETKKSDNEYNTATTTTTIDDNEDSTISTIITGLLTRWNPLTAGYCHKLRETLGLAAWHAAAVLYPPPSPSALQTLLPQCE
eukprot:scaffold2742_cov167-Amphora_coffeaeformis.AAC.1